MCVAIATQYLKQRPAQAYKEDFVNRAALERAEEAVFEGKKERDADTAERESQLQSYREDARRLEGEVRFGFSGDSDSAMPRATTYP